MFRIGQKVVCINSEPRPGRAWVYGDPPALGAVYTVEDIIPEDGSICLVLAEQRRATDSTFRGYWFQRFRPVVERTTDISIFQAMLTPSPVTVDAMKVSDHAREIVR